MKKIVILLFVIVLLTGCGKNSTTENKEKSKYKQITSEEVYSRLNESENREVYIIDVRTSAEYSNGHIPAALNIPLSSITSIENVIPDRSVEIIVYCQSGNRSKKAADSLLELGYQEVYDLGGINNWNYEITQ